MQITYGPLSPSEWERYKNFRLKALKEEPEAFGAAYDEELLFPKETWQQWITNMMFALEDGTIVGMIGAVPDASLPKVQLVSFYVLPTKRGQGIGAALIKNMINKFAREKQIVLNVVPTNIDLMPYYEKLGFKVIEQNNEGYLMQYQQGHK